MELDCHLVEFGITLNYMINNKHMPTFLLGHALMKHRFYAMVCQYAMVPKLISSGAMMLPYGASWMLMIGNLYLMEEVKQKYAVECQVNR